MNYLDSEQSLRMHTLTETAAMLGISEYETYSFVNSGELPAMEMFKKLLIPRQSICEFLNERLFEPVDRQEDESRNPNIESDDTFTNISPDEIEYMNREYYESMIHYDENGNELYPVEMMEDEDFRNYLEERELKEQNKDNENTNEE